MLTRFLSALSPDRALIVCIGLRRTCSLPKKLTGKRIALSVATSISLVRPSLKGLPWPSSLLKVQSAGVPGDIRAHIQPPDQLLPLALQLAVERGGAWGNQRARLLDRPQLGDP